MADAKTNYSNKSNHFINYSVKNNEGAKKAYSISKKKEEQYNLQWDKQKVNINDIVNKFAPNSIGYVNGYKYIYDGDVYQVVADMVSGSLRIKNKLTNQYVKLDGKPGNNSETHFKIKKRGEM